MTTMTAKVTPWIEKAACFEPPEPSTFDISPNAVRDAARSAIPTVRGFVVALGGAPRSELWIYVGTTMSFIVGAIPALPGGWGTSDAAYVYFFGKAGLAPSIALAVSLLYRLFWYASGGVGAVLYLLRSHRSAQDSVSAPDAAPSAPNE